ncbi:disulfide bond formation protein B [Helicobacter sp. MIT 11-5569]|uniref:disulfide bond formation protein B n=1 Tax=Helicobacter sp. MIT 11-5569 TaxID=1548151 RepID=UPI00051FB790|nr:disulfide bond formation protein B [Helicobacter sp. MIT 11-5569]TLD80617.1 disulfide bond formation protein B [Helicobacter sp. MIT 11-5569]
MMQCLKNLSKKREVWFLFGVAAFFFVAFSHFILQKYLLLQPCEQCVYIRYAFVVLGIGCMLVAVNPKSLFGLFGILICIYALIKGIVAALMLDKIQKALQSETMVFGLKGCSLYPKFDFNLPLDIWIPQLFAPYGFCGIETPMINGITLSPLQEKLVAFYSEGWYLIPVLKFGTMAQCAFGIFILYAILITLLFIDNFYQR